MQSRQRLYGHTHIVVCTRQGIVRVASYNYTRRWMLMHVQCTWPHAPSGGESVAGRVELLSPDGGLVDLPRTQTLYRWRTQNMGLRLLPIVISQTLNLSLVNMECVYKIVEDRQYWWLILVSIEQNQDVQIICLRIQFDFIRLLGKSCVVMTVHVLMTDSVKYMYEFTLRNGVELR